MRRKLHGANLSHQDRSGRKQRHFGKDGDADRQAKAQHFEQRMPVRPPEAHEQLVFPGFLTRLHISDDEDEAEGIDDDGDDGRAVHAHHRQSEMAEDQRIGHQTVHHQHDDGDIQNDARTAYGTDKPAQHVKKQRRQKAELGDGEIMAGQRRNFGVLPEIDQNALGVEEYRQGKNPVRDCNPHAHAQRAAGSRRIALPVSLRYHWHHGHGKSRAENEDNEEELPGQHHCRQLLSSELTDDDHICSVDAKLRELRTDKRDSKRKRSLEMRKPRPRSRGNGFCNNRRRHCNSPEFWPLPANCAMAAGDE
ncbi:hypothetical protein AGR1B_Cc10410 [Agrobacterium fabacearum S56]|nr:hypothetical protein AGR1B_Cc10410 [Agrobacterium fabacearum S56]